MTVRIRLRKMGTIRKATYRLVVTDSRSSRNGAYLESIGYYNPRSNPAEEKVEVERALYWLKQGAKPSEAAEKILARAGIRKTFKQKL
jgi:small subunit ribosomal protein S16